MPAKSKSQQKFMAIVRGLQKGTIKPSDVRGAAKKVAKSMKKKSAKDYASTKHKGLPNKVKSEYMSEDGHTDVASVERKLKLIVGDAVDTIKRLRSMSNDDSLPSWWTDKITLAKDYVSKSRDYIMNPAEEVDEGFGGELTGKDKKKFEQWRKDNAEQLGYELTGTSDIKESVNEGYTVYTTDKRGKKVKKIKSYGSRQAAAVAMGKLMKNLDTDYFPKNIDGLMYIKEFVNEKTVSIGGKDLMKYLMKRFKMSKSQAIASMKKHKMDMSFLKKESVDEIFPKGAGRKISKAMQKKVEPAGTMAKIQKIVNDKQATKLGGVMVDMQSASLLMKLYDKVSDKDKERMNKFPAKKLTLVIKRLWDRVNLKLPL
jgi:hypothetical protein